VSLELFPWVGFHNKCEPLAPGSMYFFKSRFLAWEKICAICLSESDFSLSLSLLFETECHYVVQTGLELSNLLPQPPKCWHYSHEPPHPARLISLNTVISSCNHFSTNKIIYFTLYSQIIFHCL
jgi:hypothetical protein